MSQQSNTQNSKEFTNNLVVAITGNQISDFDPEYQVTIVQECINAFTNFITEFVTAKYCEVDAIRLKSSLQFSGDIFTRFPDLEVKFSEAYESFLYSLSLANA